MSLVNRVFRPNNRIATNSRLLSGACPGGPSQEVWSGGGRFGPMTRLGLSGGPSFHLPFRLLLPRGFPPGLGLLPQEGPPTRGTRLLRAGRRGHTGTGSFPWNSSLLEKGGSHFLGSLEPSSPCLGPTGPRGNPSWESDYREVGVENMTVE